MSRRISSGAAAPDVTSAHFLYIPAVMLLGIVIGWILGSRAAADAYAAQLKRLQERAARDTRITGNQG